MTAGKELREIMKKKSGGDKASDEEEEEEEGGEEEEMSVDTNEDLESAKGWCSYCIQVINLCLRAMTGI